MQRNRPLSEQAVSILFAFADQHPNWRHGYDLCANLGLKAGSMYPILGRLAERGWLETEWEKDLPAGRPPRHQYRLSEAGLNLVSQLRAFKRRTPLKR